MGGGSVTMAARDGLWERKGVCDQVRRHRLWAVYGYERLEWVMSLERTTCTWARDQRSRG